MMKEILILSNILPRIPPGLHPQVSQYHSLTITSLTNRESTPRPKTFVKYDPEFVFKSKTVLTNKQEHPNRSCLLKSVKREPENVSLQGTVFRLPKTVKRILLKSSLSQGNALSDDIAATTDPKVTVTVNSNMRKLLSSEVRCTRQKAKPALKAVANKEVSTSAESDGDEAQKPAATKKEESSSDDESSDEDVKPAAKKAAPAKPAPKAAAKKEENSSDEDSSDEDEKPCDKKAAPAKPSPKDAAKKEESSSGEDSSDEEETKPAVKKPAVKSVAMIEESSDEDSSDSDDEKHAPRRLKDKVAEIRSHAVTALQRLQDPRDEECPIIRAYLFHLAHDPNNVVKRTIVRCIGATRLTLPYILERTRDTDEHVRRAAYKFLAEKVHIKSLTIGQREGVLGRGLGERSEAVRRVVEKEMIPGWLMLSNNNTMQLLHHLDVGNSDQGTKQGAKSAPAGALNVLFMDTLYVEMVNSFQYLDTDMLIPYEKLTPETAMYWRVLAECFAKQNGPGAEEYLESVLPELTPFCLYVRRYILELEKDDEDVNWELVAKELISMTTNYDLGDEVGRQNLCKLIKDLLTSSKTSATFLNSLVTVFTNVEKNAQSRVDQVAEIISDLKDPIDIAPTDPMSPEYHSALETPSQQVRQDEEVIRAKQLQIAKLRVEMNLLRDQLDEAVTGQNFLIAQQIKAQMDQLVKEQAMMENQLSAAKAVGAAPHPSATKVDPTPSATAAQLDLSVSCSALENPAVALKCLRLLVATLQDPSITQLNATLLTLLEFVMVSVQSELPAIRKEAITAMACCCLRSIENGRQHMLLLLQAVHIDVHVAVSDLLMKHSLSSFITQEEPELDVSGRDSSVTPSRCVDSADSHSNSETAMESYLATLTQSELNTQGGNSVVAILTKILDEPDSELKTEVAEGLCKLLMVDSINSPKVLSCLLLIW